jgi:hypothetical protein
MPACRTEEALGTKAEIQPCWGVWKRLTRKLEELDRCLGRPEPRSQKLIERDAGDSVRERELEVCVTTIYLFYNP